MKNQLSFEHIRTLALSALGGALEFYDFIIFVFFAKTLGALFFPAEMPSWMAQIQVYGIFAAGYVTRPVGGIVMAHYGDKLGRKMMFSLSVLLMAFPTLLIGFLPTYQSIGIWAPLLLLVLRVIQGIAIGGEVPAAWVFVAEHVPKGRESFACASLTSGLTLGILLGSLMASAIYRTEDLAFIESFGWRIPFWVGGVCGFLAVWLRRWLKETPVFEEMKHRKELHSDIPLKTVLRVHKLGVVLSMLVTWMLTAAIVVVILMVPTLVQSASTLTAKEAFTGNNIAALVLTLSCLVGGLLADRFGRLRILAVGSVMLASMVFLFFADISSGGVNFLGLYALVAACVGVIGLVPSVIISLFPAQVRFSGVSFSYNIAYAIFGALTPPLIAYLSSHFGIMAGAYYVIAAAMTCLLICLYLGLRKTA